MLVPGWGWRFLMSEVPLYTVPRRASLPPFHPIPETALPSLPPLTESKDVCQGAGRVLLRRATKGCEACD
jgi:hypothetical protein